ncbi:MAG TPA: hypothetical protein VIV55_08095 [Flavobacterium sp.]
MKAIIIVMSLITSVFYAQNSDEIELANRINNLVTTNIPNLAGKNYFIFDATETDTFIISKINNNYTYYKLHINRGPGVQISSRVISFHPVIDKIFTNFTPKTGVKKYLSEYERKDFNYSVPPKIYFAIYKNGVKTFDYYLPSHLDNNPIESPIDNETLSFLYEYLLVNPDKL